MATKKIKKSQKKYTKKPRTKQSKIIWAILTLLLIFLAALFLTNKQSFAPTPNDMSSMQENFNFGNQTITLDGETLNFTNGKYENPDTTYGQHTAEIVNKTTNSSGSQAAAILVDSPGGSGTFYYLIGASKIDGKEFYSTPISLGDRIKIVSVSVENPGATNNGIIIVKYLTRPENAPMSDDPTVEVTAKYAFEDSGNLIQVLQ
jgi:hypothetical protein